MTSCQMTCCSPCLMTYCCSLCWRNSSWKLFSSWKAFSWCSISLNLSPLVLKTCSMISWKTFAWSWTSIWALTVRLLEMPGKSRAGWREGFSSRNSTLEGTGNCLKRHSFLFTVRLTIKLNQFVCSYHRHMSPFTLARQVPSLRSYNSNLIKWTLRISRSEKAAYTYYGLRNFFSSRCRFFSSTVRCPQRNASSCV